MITLKPMSLHKGKDFKLKNYFSVPCFYDSHLHFEGLGKYNSKNNLSLIQSLEEFKAFIYNQDRETSISNTFEAFGLKTHLSQDLLNLNCILKSTKNITNFYIVLEDGHQLLVHGSTLLNYLQNVGQEDIKEIKLYQETGLFNDFSRKKFDKFYTALNRELSTTKSTNDLKKSWLTKAQLEVLKSGVTHFRDLTSDLDQLDILLSMEKEESLKVFPETYYSNFFGQNIEDLIQDSINAKQLCQNEKSKIKHNGIKIFLDGTFSQKTVDTIANSNWKNCLCHNNQSKSELVSTFFSALDIKDILLKASEQGLEVAFHTIGDLAVEKVISAFDRVKSRFNTKLNLEHCELISPETMTFLKKLSPAEKAKLAFHFQPSHFLLDKSALAPIIKAQPQLHVFNWSELHRLGFKVFFGSDAPVSKLGLNYVKELFHDPFFIDQYSKSPFWSFFNHPEFSKWPNTFTLFSDLEIQSVYIHGQKV